MNSKAKFRQLLTTLLVNIFGLMNGMAISITTIMLPRLLDGEKGPYFYMKIDKEEMSYIGKYDIVAATISTPATLFL